MKLLKPNSKFAIITADNPTFGSAGDSSGLQNDLTSAGYEVEPIISHFGTQHTAFAVHNPNFRHVAALAKKYGQNSLILSENGHNQIHYVNGENAGLSLHGDGHTVFNREPEALYLKGMHNGQPVHFSLNFDWDEPPKAADLGEQALAKSEDRYLVHFGTTPGLTELDPDYMGTSNVESVGGGTKVPRLYFYREGVGVPERIVVAQATTKYLVRAPEDSTLYDLSTDNDHLRSPDGDSEERSDQLLQAVKSAGYKGCYASASQLPNVVMLFHKVPIVAEIPAPENMWGAEGREWVTTDWPKGAV